MIFIVVLWSAMSLADELTFKEVCRYDEFCRYLKDGKGEMRRLDLDLIERLRPFAKPAKKWARDFGVDARAVLGSIAADMVQQLMGSDGANIPRDQLIQASRPGRIQLPTAMDGERLMAKMQRRNLRSEDEVARRLQTPDGACEYAAGIIRLHQNDYVRQGFQIANRPDLLATLYNVGDSGKRALAAKRNKRSPRPNSFGFYVGAHDEILRKLLDEAK